MSEPPIPPLAPGDTVAHYRIEGLVGQGAMGLVYRAHDLALDRTVGVKVLRPEVAADQRFVDRFVREARAAARVAHANVAHVYFVGEQAGRHFFAMEFVEGMDLEQRVATDGPLALGRAIDVVVQAARGLAAAHRAGVVHRDVKPSNLLLQNDGLVRITDFGLARSLDAKTTATQAGLLVGTPAYMSPEQCLGAALDARTDVYALGLTAWYALAGGHPWENASLGALIDHHVRSPLPSLRALRPDLPPQLDEVLARMCAKDAAVRFPDMDSVIRALEACRPRPLQPAPLATRAAAAVLDLALALGLLAFEEFVARRLVGTADITHTWWGLGLFSLAFGAYHVGSELRWGRTFGKWALGIQVVAAGGGRVPPRALVPRLLVRYPFVAWDVLGIGHLVPVLRQGGLGLQAAAILGGLVAWFLVRGRSLSDVLTRTGVVVAVSPVPPEGGP